MSNISFIEMTRAVVRLNTRGVTTKATRNPVIERVNDDNLMDAELEALFKVQKVCRPESIERSF